MFTTFVDTLGTQNHIQNTKSSLDLDFTYVTALAFQLNSIMSSLLLSAVHKHSTIEESILLPSAEKIGIVFLTLLYEATRSLSIEETVGTILTVISIVLVVLAWWFSATKLRTAGLVLLACGLAVPTLLGPSVNLPVTHIAKFSKSNPPHFPRAGRITRSGITTEGLDGWFRETSNLQRIILLRGVNFGASTKIPSSNAATHIKNADFYSDHTKVSFVSRPCPLNEADEHFARIASWGFNVLRLLITWEAVEHEGPGIYDFEYLDYLRELCRKANKHGLSVFIDPHQDVWSRFTGGDGK